MTPDEPCAAGDENAFHRASPLSQMMFRLSRRRSYPDLAIPVAPDRELISNEHVTRTASVIDQRVVHAAKSKRAESCDDRCGRRPCEKSVQRSRSDAVEFGDPCRGIAIRDP